MSKPLPQAKPQVVEITRTTATHSAGNMLPVVAEHAPEDFVHRKGDLERLRQSYCVPRRRVLELVVLGLCRRLFRLERQMEARRDGFGKPVAREMGKDAERRIA